MAYYYVDPSKTGGNNDGGGDGALGDPSDQDNWTDAWTDLQIAVDAVIAGDTVYCRGTQTVTAQIDVDTANSGTAASPIEFIGCDSNGVPGGDYFTLDGANNTIHGLRNAINNRSYFTFKNFKFYRLNDAKSSASTVHGYWLFKDCLFANNVRAVSDSAYSDYATYYRCRFENQSGITIYRTDSSRFEYCSFVGNSGIVMDAMGSGLRIFGCLFWNNTGTHVIFTYSGDSFILNSIFHGNTGNCINCTSYEYHYGQFSNCRFTNNGVGIAAGSYRRRISGCYFQGNTTNYTGYIEDVSDLSVFDGTDDDYGYMDSTNGNFNLTPTATLRSVPITLP